MAVAITGTPATATPDFGASPYTGFTYTPEAGSDRLVVVVSGVGVAAANHQFTGMTLGGQTMTAVAANLTDGVFLAMRVFWLKEAGIAAMSGNTLSIAFTGDDSDKDGILAFTLTGVDQTTPVTSPQTGSGNGTTAQASASVTSTSGGMVIAGMHSDSQDINTSTAHSGTTIVYTAVQVGDTITAAQRTAGTGGSINLTWTQPAEGYVVTAFNVQASAGAGTVIDFATPVGLSVVGGLMDVFNQWGQDAKIIIRKA